MKTSLGIILVMVTMISSVLADKPVGERPRIFVSEHWKKVIFCMMPGKYEYVPERKIISEPYGIAYRLEADGSMSSFIEPLGGIRLKFWCLWMHDT